ncbi:hypothetical protein AURDEDRAFT_173563 [Auricularia subglabra TFB-10046 SS5]|nr:hypothetical protein AURDEDRAFT_173563 [Auricularia subglabra TFB-10046 SS5]
MSVPRNRRSFLSRIRLYKRRGQERAAAQSAEPHTHAAGPEAGVDDVNIRLEAGLATVAGAMAQIPTIDGTDQSAEPRARAAGPEAGVDDIDIKLEAGLATVVGAGARIPTIDVTDQYAVTASGAGSVAVGAGVAIGAGVDLGAGVALGAAVDEPAAVHEEEPELGGAHVERLPQDVENGVGSDERANASGEDVPPTATRDQEPEAEGARAEAPEQGAGNDAPVPLPPTTAEVVVRAIRDMAQYFAREWVAAAERTFPAVHASIFAVLTVCVLVSPLLPLVAAYFAGFLVFCAVFASICLWAVLFQCMRQRPPPSST